MIDQQIDNRLRSIGKLAVVGGWFEPETECDNRYALHLSATFREERLGGVPESNIHFRVSLKQCEIVTVLPERGNGFRIDQKTMARTKPGPAIAVNERLVQKDEAGGSLQLNIDNNGIMGKAAALISRKYERTSDTTDVRDVPRMEAMHSETPEGHPSWVVSTILSQLEGAVWDASTEPRFTIVDNRPESQVQAEKENNMPPMALIQVRCKREDLKVYHVEFKDLTRDGIRQNSQNQEVRQRAAEAFLKAEIQRQGLFVGDIGDKFSEMTLAEYVVPLFE